jgi:uncharacterized MAPEG superfamily protein
MRRFNEWQQAEARRRARFDFNVHVAAFVVSCLVLLPLYFFTSPGLPWLLWLLGMWAFAVLIHGIALLRPIERLLQRMNPE